MIHPMDNTEKVLTAFKNAAKAVKADDIVKTTGLERKEVDKAIKKLKADNKIASPKVCFYEYRK